MVYTLQPRPFNFVQRYEKNFDRLFAFQPITGQQTSWNIKAGMPLVERSLNGRTFVVVSYACKPVLQKELRWYKLYVAWQRQKPYRLYQIISLNFQLSQGWRPQFPFKTLLFFWCALRLCHLRRRPQWGHFSFDVSLQFYLVFVTHGAQGIAMSTFAQI